MWPWWVMGGLLGVAGLALVWRPLRSLSRHIQLERARELFRLQRERLEAAFFQAASLTGRPRGLRWKECVFAGDLQLARDRRSGQLVGLAAATSRFEAIEGSDMEDLPAVGNLRNASAAFFFHRGQWHTIGKAVFNLNPEEALHHFRKQYELLPDHDSDTLPSI
jgi:hypothetical protein